MENYSLSDIAAVTDGNRNNGGLFDGLGGSGALILIILFILIFGANGFGNRGGYGGGGGGTTERVIIDSFSGGGKNVNGLVTEAGLCNAMNFNNLENAVGRMSDQQAAIARQTDNAICNLGYESLRNFNALSAQVANCCCETQRAIDSVNYNNAMNTAAINQHIDCKIQSVLDTMCANRMSDMQNQINDLRLNAALAGVVRYPNGFVYTAGGSPFCGTCNPCNGNQCCNM